MGRFGLAGWLVVFGVSVSCGGIASRRVPSDDESGGSATGGSFASNGGIASGGNVASAGSSSRNDPSSGGNVAVGTATCVTDSGVHTQGDTFTADDGCNICKCERNGHLECTSSVCADSCEGLTRTYATYLDSASHCSSDAECTTTRPNAPGCACPVWLNGGGNISLPVLDETLYQFGEQRCAPQAPCSPCLALPRVRCVNGRCQGSP